MTGPSSSPRPEHTPRPGATWETHLVRTETVVDDDAPDPAPPNRATRRALARAARQPIRQYPDELRARAETDDLTIHPSRRNQGATMTDAEVRTATRPYTGRYGSPISRLHHTGAISEHTRDALLDRATYLDADGLHGDADRLRDAADYVLDAGCRPPVTGWTER
ncbi:MULTISPECIES: hypothetical protein [unclassified Streptomyces]|uniref:hypothetical protein n=1 Tax=unclassified Streptomyces TaxID=2593676 RepID=UPI000DD7E554|nr:MULTISPECIES: hypothetical protein [unclassified Streptomyces]QZZ24900.1 hypothetical protein A7X85_10055 [Streptomyces sp. ST1015]